MGECLSEITISCYVACSLFLEYGSSDNFEGLDRVDNRSLSKYLNSFFCG